MHKEKLSKTLKPLKKLRVHLRVYIKTFAQHCSYGFFHNIKKPFSYQCKVPNTALYQK